MTNQAQLILDDAWRQCERHLHHMRHALNSLLAKIKPLVNAN